MVGERRRSTESDRLKRVLLVWVLVRILLLALTLVNGRLPYAEEASEWKAHPDGFRYRQIPSRVFDTLHRFDARGYHSIAVSGYDRMPMSEGSNTAFFPGYTWLAEVVFRAMGLSHEGPRGLDPRPMFHVLHALSSLLFLASLFLIHRWTRMRFDETVATRTCLFFVLAPWTFVFDAPFSESCFLFAMLLAMDLAERRRWVPALLVAAFCTVTRSVGGVVGLAILHYYIRDPERRARGIGYEVLAFLLPPLALWAYFVHVGQANGKMFAYFEQQHTRFGHGDFPTISGLIDLVDPATKKDLWFWARDAVQLAATLAVAVGLGLLVKATRRWQPGQGAYVTLSALLLILPLLSGALISMPRYVSVLFPVYAAWAAYAGAMKSRVVLAFIAVPLLAVTWILWILAYPVII